MRVIGVNAHFLIRRLKLDLFRVETTRFRLLFFIGTSFADVVLVIIGKKGVEVGTKNFSFESALVVCHDPLEVGRKVKLALKKMPGETALACFAKVMTTELPHPIKVAVWDAVRYSHIWWGVDEILKGQILENPMVLRAFADAVPVRMWVTENKLPGFEPIQLTVRDGCSLPLERFSLALIPHLVRSEDEECADLLERTLKGQNSFCEQIKKFVDVNGNNLLWYLTYRDDQNAKGGFACPCIERKLLEIGVDSNHFNNIGLCWNDVRHHVIRNK